MGSKSPQPEVFFSSPRRLPVPASLPGRVAVLDIAFAADGSGGVSFRSVTLPFLEGLGDRLAAWVDHHDHPEFDRFAEDERFVLATKQQVGACPEMITPELVSRTGPVQSLLVHLDLDGLYAGAKWILGGNQPYPEADSDAHAVDTRLATPGPVGRTIDQALRAHYRDHGLRYRILQFLTRGGNRSSPDWEAIREASTSFEPILRNTRKMAKKFQIHGRVAMIRVPAGARDVDKTELLLLGQEHADIAVVEQSGMITMAARFDSGFDFPGILGLRGGMPTRTSAPADRLADLLRAVNEPARNLDDHLTTK